MNGPLASRVAKVSVHDKLRSDVLDRSCTSGLCTLFSSDLGSVADTSFLDSNVEVFSPGECASLSLSSAILEESWTQIPSVVRSVLVEIRSDPGAIALLSVYVSCFTSGAGDSNAFPSLFKQVVYRSTSATNEANQFLL